MTISNYTLILYNCTGFKYLHMINTIKTKLINNQLFKKAAANGTYIYNFILNDCK